MVDFEQKEKYTMDDLLNIMVILRGENGCPWDREQDHHTIRKNFLEETYEVLEAIDENNPEHAAGGTGRCAAPGCFPYQDGGGSRRL